MAIDTMRETLSDPEIQALIRAREIADHDNATALASAKQEGLREGEARGREQTARQMLLQGYPLDEIAKLTGLSQDRVRNLQQQN